MTCRTSRKLSFASPRITTLESASEPTAVRSPSLKWSAVTCRSSIHSLPASSMETRIRPLSSPWLLGFAVFGTFTSGPLRICGAITMKMISSTSTTSTSGVMLMAACNWVVSPSRMRCLRLFHARHPELRYFEQTVHELGRHPVHLYVESLNLARESVECDDGRDRDENTQGGRHEGLSHTARNYAHSSGPRGRDASESVDDSHHGTEQSDERRRSTDRGHEPEPPFQLDQRLGHGIPNYALNELDGGARIASGLAQTVVLEHACRYNLRHVRFLVLRQGIDQFLGLSPLEEILEHWTEHLRLAHRCAKSSLLLNDHGH